MLPTQKVSKTRTRTRRAHHALTPPQFLKCPICSQAKVPYGACDNCGFVNAKVQLKRETEEA